MDENNQGTIGMQDNEICLLCGKTIEGEQAVYCPDCGAPYHLACWQEHGECVLKDKHSKDFVYVPASQKSASPNPYGQSFNNGNPYVQNQGGVNPYGQNQSGGNPYNQNPYGGNPYGQNRGGGNPYSQNPYNQSPYGENPGDDPFFSSFGINDGFREKSDEEMEREFGEKKYMGVSQREMMCFMNVNSPAALYRVALFKYMAENGRKMSLNFFAGCLSPYNQFYKGMIPLGLLVMAVNFVTSLPQLIFYYFTFFSPEKAEQFLTNSMMNTISTLTFIQWGLVILLCLFGDYLYLLFMTKKIKKIRSGFTDETSEEYLNALAAAGKPRMGKVVICFGIQAILILLAMVIMAAVGL